MSAIWKVDILSIFDSTKIPGYFLAFKKVSEAQVGNLQKNEIYIYIQYAVRCCVIGKRVNRGAGYGLEIFVT